MPHKLYPYQREGVFAAEAFDGRILLADEQGLGKTLQAIWYIHRDRTARLPAVVVCPASVKYNWEHEIMFNLGIRPTVLEGTNPPRQGYKLAAAPRVVIINYDILKPWMEYLRGLGLRTVIADECHYCMSRDTLRTKMMKLLTKETPNFLALSGTPLTNRPADLWPTLNMLWPASYKSFWSYAQTYCDAHKGFWGWTYKGAKNIPELHAELKKHGMVRRLKADVLKELPDKVRRVIPVPMSDPLEYRRAQTDFILWLTKLDPARAKSAARAQKLVQIGYLKRLAAQLKIDAVAEWIDNHLQGGDGKLVVFAVHKGMIKALRERCRYKSVTIDGSITGRLRQAAAVQFQKDKGTRVLFGNIQAAGVGLTLTAADTAVFTELGWKPAEHSQAEDRIHRITQTQKAFIYYLVAAGTIEQTLCELIQQKQEIIRGVLDGEGGGEGLDIYDLLCAGLLKTGAA